MTPLAAQGPWPLPPEFAARVRAAEDTGRPVPPARPAATVALLRDGAAGVEVYLLRRVTSMAFAAGMHVFPGGTVDARDEALPSQCWVGPTAQQWAGSLSAPPPLAKALVCAAVRETFEESGVLLAGRKGQAAGATGRWGEVLDDVSGDSWERDRQALLNRSLSLADLLAGRGLCLRADLLRPWSHWITPEIEPRRYDTRFFVAALPVGQLTRHVGGEADAVAWLRPGQVLDAVAAGKVAVLPPTAATLAELSGHDTVADVLAAAAARDVQPLLPRIVLYGEEAVVVLPGEPEYDL